jgi:hypothetical protein
VPNTDTCDDPPGIRVRPILGASHWTLLTRASLCLCAGNDGCSYLAPGALTNSLSYVMGPLLENLTDLGYTSRNLAAMPYDWRLPLHQLEVRVSLLGLNLCHFYRLLCSCSRETATSASWWPVWSSCDSSAARRRWFFVTAWEIASFRLVRYLLPLELSINILVVFSCLEGGAARRPRVGRRARAHLPCCRCPLSRGSKGRASADEWRADGPGHLPHATGRRDVQSIPGLDRGDSAAAASLLASQHGAACHGDVYGGIDECAQDRGISPGRYGLAEHWHCDRAASVGADDVKKFPLLTV